MNHRQVVTPTMTILIKVAAKFIKPVFIYHGRFV